MAWQSKRSLRVQIADKQAQIDRLIQRLDASRRDQAALQKSTRVREAWFGVGLRAFFTLNPRMADAYVYQVTDDYGVTDKTDIDIDKWLQDCQDEVKDRQRKVEENQRRERLKSGKLEPIYGGNHGD